MSNSKGVSPVKNQLYMIDYEASRAVMNCDTRTVFSSPPVAANSPVRRLDVRDRRNNVLRAREISIISACEV